MKDTLGFKPLYKQVYDRLVQRISEGEWKPPEALPSEYALADELGVSQGTVRKALNVMEAEKLVERRQGKGTFVSEHTDEASIFRFFRLTRVDGTRLKPEGELESIGRRQAKRQEKLILGLEGRAQVIEMRRIRIVDHSPCVAETIILPHALFPDFDKLEALSESLYPLYQSQFGVHIVNAQEQLRAEVATKDNARRLEIPVGTPLLRVDRVALTIDKKRVEWRSSLCDTRNFVYSINVS
jgi:GntR family transcriptional regulator